MTDVEIELHRRSRRLRPAATPTTQRLRSGPGKATTAGTGSFHAVGEQDSPRGPFRLLVESGFQSLYASRDVVAGRRHLSGRTAETVVTYWTGGIRAEVIALAPCPGIRLRCEP